MSIVRLKNKTNGVVYVYESQSYWDKEKNQARNTRVCIGKIDPKTDEIIYNKQHVSQKEQKVGRPVQIEYKRTFYGATYLFDKIGQKLGIVEDLQRCFGKYYQQILSIVYYLILEDHTPLYRFGKWGRLHDHPFGKEITSQMSSELFASIDEDSKQKFFNLQSARWLEKEYLAYDTTSISSYSQTLKQVKYGHNKDHDPLAQINLALLMGKDSRLPICYRKLGGNISDVKTIKKLIRDLQTLPIQKIKLILDRGFYSQENIDDLYANHYKFLISTKNSTKLVKEYLYHHCSDMITHHHYNPNQGLYAKTFTTQWNTKTNQSKRIYLHIFYNEQRAIDDKVKFYKLLDQLREEIETNNTQDANNHLYTKYCICKSTPKRGVSVVFNDDAIKQKERSFGYFALLSNDIKDPNEAIITYRSKDVIEKGYDDLKNRLGMKRTSVSSEESLEGKLFVQFIALIYISYIKKQMDKYQLFKQYTLSTLLDQIDIIERFNQPNRTPILGEVTEKQKKIYEMMEVDPIL